MRWNWQLPDWPNFRFDADAFRVQEAQFLKLAGFVIGSMNHLGDELQIHLAVELVSSEIIDSSAIEGEVLDRDSVQSSLARHFGFKVERHRSGAAEAGASELLADIYKNYDKPLTHEILFEWHRMIMNGRRDIVDIGRYRTHEDAMQIVSGGLHAPRVHFEAPPSQTVLHEMKQFIAWFNKTGPGSISALPAVTRAAISHLWFESIHPFEDGNGRIGRAIAEQALAQGVGAPTLTALSQTILKHKKAYYSALHLASQSNDLQSWLIWFEGIVTEAQTATINRISFVIAKTHMLDRLRGKINPRQEKVLIRMFEEGPDGFKSGLSAKNYLTITGTSTATSTRDLAELVQLEALRKIGEHRYTRYLLNLKQSRGIDLQRVP